MTENLPNRAGQFDGLNQLARASRLRRWSTGRDGNREETGDAQPRPAEIAASPLQFRLRTMLYLVAVASGLLALMQLIGAVWSSVLVALLLLGGAHVSANFWGTRVAPWASHRARTADEPVSSAAPDRPITPMVGPARLSESCRPGWPMLVATGVGALVGGSLGSVALVMLSLERAGYCGVIVGTISAAAVGGFLGFLASSFAEIAFRAWKEAIETAPARPAPEPLPETIPEPPCAF
ncbi:MAG TPA: hypothetical protein VNH11_05080 [Pirellulales bacterium]|nr:hypothetical protein [Pirellulales bacterium]